MVKQKNAMRYVTGYVVGFFIFFGIIPLVLYIIARTFDHCAPIGIIAHDQVRIILSLLLLMIGLFFAIWSNVSLLVIGKGGPADAFGVAISPRTRHLVIKGPYQYTRNPMVFGVLVCYFAIALYLNSIICIALLVAFIPLVVFYIKIFEEKRLLKDFGEEYLNYIKAVSMILPTPNKTRMNKR